MNEFVNHETHIPSSNSCFYWFQVDKEKINFNLSSTLFRCPIIKLRFSEGMSLGDIFSTNLFRDYLSDIATYLDINDIGNYTPEIPPNDIRKVGLLKWLNSLEILLRIKKTGREFIIKMLSQILTNNSQCSNGKLLECKISKKFLNINSS